MVKESSCQVGLKIFQVYIICSNAFTRHGTSLSILWNEMNEHLKLDPMRPGGSGFMSVDGVPRQSSMPKCGRFV
jgi:hypothetical protein